MRTNAPGQSALLLLDVIAVLNKRKISYAVIGAFAASFYGVVRASLDADAAVSFIASSDIDDLCRKLKQKGYTIENRKGDVDDPIARVLNIHDKFSNRVDLLIGIQGMQEAAFKRCRKVKFIGSNINIVGPEDFIAMKISAGNAKDMQDVAGVLKVSGTKIDRKLLHQIAGDYGRDCLKRLKEFVHF